MARVGQSAIYQTETRVCELRLKRMAEALISTKNHPMTSAK